MEYISLCPGETPTFLWLFDPSTRPSLLFYTYVPTIILSLALGIYVLYKDRFSKISRLLFAVALSFSLWVLNILFLWIASHNSVLMFAWQVNPLTEISIFLFSIYLTYVFTDIKRGDVSALLKVILLLIFVPFIVLLPTAYNIINYDINSCEGVLGPLWDFMYIFEMVAVVWIVGIGLNRYRTLSPTKPEERIHRQKIAWFTAGITSFLVLFIGSNILGETLERQEISFIGSLGMTLFLGFLAYLIVRYRSFNARLIGANVLVATLWVMVGSLLFVAQSEITRIVVGVTEIIALIFGAGLINSVRREVAQREQIQELAERLRLVNVDLEVANIKLKELDKQKTEFLSFATHQLRSPLTAIKGYTSMILEGSFGEVGEKAREAVDVVAQSAQKLVVLVEDFLNVTRIELGKLKYEFNEVDIKKLARDTVEQLRPVAEQKHLTLATEVDEGQDYRTMADGGKIAQVIGNLVDNAIKYTEQGTISVRLNRSGQTIRIEIKDTGVGLDEETIAKLFQRFSRAEDAVKMNTGGTGLGLYVAKEMVAGHGGKLWAESPGKNRGATFIVELPVKK